MMSFIEDYFINPIFEKTGYNIVNTTTYAILVIVALYLLYRHLFSKVKMDFSFFRKVIPFVLLGSTVRVITDSIDSGIFLPITPLHSFILHSHLYDYSFFTVSPGIYIVIASLFLSSFLLEKRIKIACETIGWILFAFHFILLFPFMKYLFFAVPVLLLAIIPYLISYKYFPNHLYRLMVFAHSLDGAATFFTIDIFSKITGKNYFEQHVIPRFIGEFFNTFFAFYLLKVLLSFTIAYFIFNDKKSSENEKNFILIVLIILGLAPGLRDLLRMVVGA